MNVALVLGSGGARGLAHIGAIEALESHGYTISSIAGCSMGSIIAGMYAAGKLAEAKEWFLNINRRDIVRLTDFSISNNSLVKGERVMKELQKIVPDCKIESLSIPLTLVASDLLTSDEVVFRSGSLFDAIRASISIPLFFQPVQWQGRLLVDGGILNPLPLRFVAREEGDLLVAMDISGKDGITVNREESDLGKLAEDLRRRQLSFLPDALQKMAREFSTRISAIERARRLNLQGTVNYISMLDRMSDMQIQQNTRLAIELTPPDILASMPQYAFNTFDFDKAETIIAEGYRLMEKAIEMYEK